MVWAKAAVAEAKAAAKMKEARVVIVVCEEIALPTMMSACYELMDIWL